MDKDAVRKLIQELRHESGQFKNWSGAIMDTLQVDFEVEWNSPECSQLEEVARTIRDAAHDLEMRAKWLEEWLNRKG